eukprot:CAMPEP_0171226982 /NCGR_PEP_ID=MMETSP0790-20130122/37605_1 /TAXON_ID=2925 /ORGANISM="Alexandrium catenella, Strain OF101" /LENGTH=204 /DNA_ID=CAMNT_0011693067 /DNA_START=40 /DNA_END=652 /DNA_ORIENTATION=-
MGARTGIRTAATVHTDKVKRIGEGLLVRHRLAGARLLVAFAPASSEAFDDGHLGVFLPVPDDVHDGGGLARRRVEPFPRQQNLGARRTGGTLSFSVIASARMRGRAPRARRAAALQGAGLATGSHALHNGPGAAVPAALRAEGEGCAAWGVLRAARGVLRAERGAARGVGRAGGSLASFDDCLCKSVRKSFGGFSDSSLDRDVQ